MSTLTLAMKNCNFANSAYFAVRKQFFLFSLEERILTFRPNKGNFELRSLTAVIKF